MLDESRKDNCGNIQEETMLTNENMFVNMRLRAESSAKSGPCKTV